MPPLGLAELKAARIDHPQPTHPPTGSARHSRACHLCARRVVLADLAKGFRAEHGTVAVFVQWYWLNCTLAGR